MISSIEHESIITKAVFLRRLLNHPVEKKTKKFKALPAKARNSQTVVYQKVLQKIYNSSKTLFGDCPSEGLDWSGSQGYLNLAPC